MVRCPGAECPPTPAAGPRDALRPSGLQAQQTGGRQPRGHCPLQTQEGRGGAGPLDHSGASLEVTEVGREPLGGEAPAPEGGRGLTGQREQVCEPQGCAAPGKGASRTGAQLQRGRCWMRGDPSGFGAQCRPRVPKGTWVGVVQGKWVFRGICIQVACWGAGASRARQGGLCGQALLRGTPPCPIMQSWSVTEPLTSIPAGQTPLPTLQPACPAPGTCPGTTKVPTEGM